MKHKFQEICVLNAFKAKGSSKFSPKKTAKEFELHEEIKLYKLKQKIIAVGLPKYLKIIWTKTILFFVADTARPRLSNRSLAT